MTGVSSVDQGVRTENIVIVEAQLAAAGRDLATQIPGLLESATQAKVKPLFVWSGLSMDEVERIDRFLGTLLAHHLEDDTTADVGAAKSVADNHLLATPASLVGHTAHVASVSEIWLDQPAALQLNPGADTTGALTGHLAAAMSTVLVNAGLPNDVDSDQADSDELRQAAQVFLLHADAQLSVMPLFIERYKEPAGVAESANPSANDLVQALSEAYPLLEGLLAEMAETEDGIYPLALCQLVRTAPRQAHKLFKTTLGCAVTTVADPASWEAREEPGQLDADLPLILVTAVREELRMCPMDTANRREAVSVAATTGYPQLYLDELTQTIGVQLPTPLDPAGWAWRVTFGGTAATIPAVGLQDPLPHPAVTVDELVYDALVGIGDEKHWRILAISIEDPILAFGADGQLITDKVSLHSTSTMVVYPIDATLADPITGAEMPLLSDPRPFDWELWQVAEIDPRDVHAVQVRQSGAAGEVRLASPQY